MDIFDEDILLLWKCLHQNDVRYIMIGGFAVLAFAMFYKNKK